MSWFGAAAKVGSGPGGGRGRWMNQHHKTEQEESWVTRFGHEMGELGLAVKHFALLNEIG
jgi:hypothetical protein